MKRTSGSKKRTRKQKNANYRQLTLEQSMGQSSVTIVTNDSNQRRAEGGDGDVPCRGEGEALYKANGEKPGASGEGSLGECSVRPTADSLDLKSSDFSEPDPDSSDEWLPSGSTESSRSSSPNAPGRHDGGKS